MPLTQRAGYACGTIPFELHVLDDGLWLNAWRVRGMAGRAARAADVFITVIDHDGRVRWTPRRAARRS